MKKSIPITLLLAILSVFAGCGVDATTELTKIDTLLQSRPDSAYARLQAIEPADLSNKNRAYYALLLTTAQYKNYVTIESDSVINIAVDYYSANPEGAKLTQALMYNGAVLAEMNLSKEALDYYKRAEQMADTTDFLVMGWINTRMGELYENSYIENKEDIARYKKALDYYTKANQEPYQEYCFSKLGKLYARSNRDSAFYCIDKAMELAQARNDQKSVLYSQDLLLATYWRYNNYQEVIDEFNKPNRENLDNFDLMKLVVSSYARLGKIDSAELYLKCLIDTTTNKKKVSYYGALKDISIAKGDYKSAHTYHVYANKLADSIVKAARIHDLYATDKRFDKRIIQNRALVLESKNKLQTYVLLLASAVIIALAVIVYLITRSKRQKLAQNELIMLQLQQDSQNSLENMQRLLETKHNNENKLKELLSNRMDMLRDIMELRYHYGDNANMFIAQFNKFIAENRQSPQVCDTAIDIANMLGENVIARIKERYCNLTDNDLLLLSLITLRFSVAETCVFMNYSSPNVVSVSRNRLARKIGTDLSLDQFVETMMIRKDAKQLKTCDLDRTVD